ncbi:MAG: hypothetical protein AAGJ70_00215 [Pseudomonadota bacterium]
MAHHHTRPRRTNQLRSFLQPPGTILIATALLIAGCGGGLDPNQAGPTGVTVASPQTLAPPSALNQPGDDATLVPSNAPPSALMTIDAAAAERALARYYLNAGADGTHRIAGADLDGDGTPEILAHVRGDTYCAPTGCALLVLRRGTTGYRVISKALRVRTPIAIARTSRVGWRDVLVRTGLPGAVKPVILPFNGTRYAANASVLPRARASLAALPELAIAQDDADRVATPANSNLIAGQN